MPTVLDSLPKATREGARKYDWTTILDGTPRAYSRGEDFEAKKSSFAQMVRSEADKRGLTVSVITVDDNTVAVQAFEPDADAESDAADDAGDDA